MSTEAANTKYRRGPRANDQETPECPAQTTPLDAKPIRLVEQNPCVVDGAPQEEAGCAHPNTQAGHCGNSPEVTPDSGGHAQSTESGTSVTAGNVPALLACSDPLSGTVRAQDIATSGAAEPDGRAHPEAESEGDPEQDILRRLSEHQASLSDWTVLKHDLARTHRCLMAALLRMREKGLLPAEWKGIPIPFPSHVRITFEPQPPNVLGSYRPGRSFSDGLKYRININLLSVLAHGLTQAMATLHHEATHLIECEWERKVGKHRERRGSYHSVAFRAVASEAGLPTTPDGRSLSIRPDGPFAVWAKEWLKEQGITDGGIIRLPVHEAPGSAPAQTPPSGPPALAPARPKKRAPRRLSWRCSCEKAVAVRVARASTIEARCIRCGELFSRDVEAN